MRFKEFLNEEDHPQLVSWVWQYCSPFLKEVGFSTAPDIYKLFDECRVFRGFNDTNGKKVEFKIGKENVIGSINEVRKDRIPRDTNPDLSNVVDDMFENKFGWRPRQQAMFATSKLGMANDYGVPHRVFPIGHFKYVWSPKVKDMAWHIRDALTAAGVKRASKGSEFSADELANFYEVISDKLEDSYKKTDLSEAIKTGNEIMFDCETYLAIPFSVSLP